MISVWTVLYLLFVHWVADFVCQTNHIANMKSKDVLVLLFHSFIYSLIFTLLMIPLVSFNFFLIIFFIFIFILHSITDGITSRINARLWKNGKVHEFFVLIGFDQWLHFAQILLLYWWLFV